MRFLPWAVAAVDLAMLPPGADGRRLKGELALLIALVVYDGYELFPADFSDDGTQRKPPFAGD